MRTRLTGALVALLLTLLAVEAVPATAAPVYPASFEERNAITGLWMPVAADWTPDGRTLIAEKPGRLKVAAPGATTATTIVDMGNRVNNNSDRGLLDVAVDSNFAANHYIYLLYTYDLNQLVPDSTGPMVSRLERYVLNNDNTLSGQTVLLGSYVSGPCPAAANTLDCIPSEGLSHSIGTVISAPDGTLYVGSGDAASYSTVDPTALGTYDESSMRGKILRIDRNGNGVGGHPFCPTDSTLSHVCAKVWSKGFRNPYRFKMRPNGGLTVADVGWDNREELDLIDPNESGKSWGWPCYEGTTRTPGYKDLAACAPEYAKEGTANAHVGPDYDYQHTGGNAIIGGPQYMGDQYPSGYRGSIFFGDYAGGFMRRAIIDSQNRVTSVTGFATGWSGTDIVQMPDGNVGYMSFGTGADGTGALKEIVYSAGNATPIAAAGGTPTSGNAPLTVAFSSTGSRDPDGDALTYAWDFGDGSSSTVANPSHTYTTTGSYTARLTVNDGRGRTASATVPINVGNGAPTVSLDAPADLSTYADGENIPLRASGSDPQDGALPSSAFSWSVSLIHGNHTHPYSLLTGASTSFTTQQDHDADSYYEITVTARDSAGLTASRTIRINSRTIKLTLASSPAGAPISYGGQSQTAPVVRDATINYLTSVAAGDSFSAADGKRYVFDSWPDGGARLHDITIPSTATTLTANYKVAPTQQIPGLVGAWGFDDGSGATARDSSGTGNNGSVSGALWSTTGRYGGALNFDGVNDWVTVPDANSLDMTGPLTMEAWVKPDTVGTWDTVMMKEAVGYFSYALYGTTAWAAPSGWARDAVAEAKQPLVAGNWTHLAFSYDGTNTRLYVNGALVTSTASPFTLPNTDQPLRIGGNNNWNTEFFDGLIDEVRVYNRVLTGAEVTTDMNTAVSGAAPPPPPPADTTPPTARITAPVAGSTVSGSTVSVTADAADNVGVASVQFKVGNTNLGSADTTAPYSATWDTTAVANGNYSLTAVARDAAGNTVTSSAVQVTVSNGSTPPPSGLVGAWSFDEGTGTTVADKSGKGNTGTVSGAAWTTTGRFGGALNFDGVNDWVTVPDANSLDMTGPLTLEAWVKPDVLGNWDTVMMKEASGYLDYAIYATGDWQVPSGWARDANAQGTQLLSTTAWSHLAYTFDGNVSKLYVNGVLVSSATMPFTLPNTTQPLRIGGNGIWSSEFFDGLIDEVRVYNRSLSAAEVTADMGKGVGSSASAAKTVSTGLRSLAVSGAPDVSLADVPASAKKLRGRKLRRGRRPHGATLHEGATAGRSASARRCPASSRKDRRTSGRAKSCKKPRARRRKG